LLLNQPTVQIVVRGGRNGYVVARDKMTDVVDILLGLGNVVVNGDTYRAILQLGDVATLGFDDSLRPMFSANFKAYVLPAPSALSQRVPIE